MRVCATVSAYLTAVRPCSAVVGYPPFSPVDAGSPLRVWGGQVAEFGQDDHETATS